MNDYITQEHIITGEAQTVSLGSVDDWSITSLRKICRKNKVPNWATMGKADLVVEVRKVIANMKGV